MAAQPAPAAADRADREVLTALARTEERRPEQRVEVTFLPEAGDGDDTPAG